MEKDTQSYIVPPAPKSVRGYLSSLDVSSDYLLFFNSNTLVLIPHVEGKPILTVTHLSDVAAARFSPDGRLVASIENRGTLIISEICPNKVVTYLQYDNVFPNAKAIDWTSDKKRLCIVGEGKNNFGRVILVESGTNAGQIIGVGASLNSCSFRPERPFKLALGGDENTLKFYEGPPYSFIKSDRPHNGYINQIKFSPKGGLLLSGGADRKLALYEGVKLQKISEKENAHNGGIFGLDWIDEEHFVTCSSDKVIKIWNTKFEEKFIIETGSAEDIKNPKKLGLFLVAVRVFKNLIYAANLQGDILVYENPFYEGKRDLIRRISGAKSKITKILPVGQNDIVLLDSGGRILHHSLSSRKTSSINCQIDIKQIIDGFSVVDKESTWLYVLLEDGSVAVYLSEAQSLNFKYLKTVSKYQSKYISAGRQKGHFIGINNEKLFIINVQKNQVVKEIVFQEEATALKANKNVVVVGTSKGKVVVFNSNLELIGQSQVKTFKITTVQFIPSLTAPEVFLILLGDSCGNMQLLQTQDNKIQVIKETMGGHSSVITAVDFDNKWIYTFSMDGKINLWNRQNLRRQNEINDTVKGGILFGISLNSYLIVAGGDYLTKVIQKSY